MYTCHTCFALAISCINPLHLQRQRFAKKEKHARSNKQSIYTANLHIAEKKCLCTKTKHQGIHHHSPRSQHPLPSSPLQRESPHPALRKRSLPKTVLHLNLPQPRQRPDLQPRLVRAQLDLNAEMPAPRRQPHEEVAWPKKTAPYLDLLESLLVHGATSVAREDEESPQGPLAGLQAFIQRSRCSPLASPSQRQERG